MGMIKDLNKVTKYLKVGQKIEVLSQSVITKSAYTEKTFTKVVKEIKPPTEWIDWPIVKFKNDKRSYAVHFIGGTMNFRWGGKREYIWVEGPTVREGDVMSLMDKIDAKLNESKAKADTLNNRGTILLIYGDNEEMGKWFTLRAGQQEILMNKDEASALLRSLKKRI